MNARGKHIFTIIGRDFVVDKRTVLPQLQSVSLLFQGCHCHDKARSRIAANERSRVQARNATTSEGTAKHMFYEQRRASCVVAEALLHTVFVLSQAGNRTVGGVLPSPPDLAAALL